ncbi:transmembrane protein 238-like [Pogona vitticeps]|uniref:Transmembrane protein 238-like n=1 Tax=Pogona vitticeps TaxID=103695 RepID=A0A6J0TWN9_9SAUR
MAPARYGHCAVFLVAALALDAVGLVLVLVGAVGHPTLEGQSFEDFLVLTGSLLLFLSLLCWLFWYSGNLGGVPSKELPLGTRLSPSPSPSPSRSRASLLRLAAKLSERLSQRRRPATWTAPAPSLTKSLGPPAKASRTAAAARPGGPVELGSLPRAVPQEKRATQERLV